MPPFNPWHEVPAGKDAPNIVRCYIEIPNGSRGKYELDKETGMLALDRVIASNLHYPANYGFIPQTYCDDKDPLDILVLCSVDIQPLAALHAKPIGVMHMVDGGEMDDKIIAVAADDKEWSHLDDISEVAPHKLRMIKNFFEDYKKLEKNKVVEVKEFEGKALALRVIKNAMDLYQKTFKK